MISTKLAPLALAVSMISMGAVAQNETSKPDLLEVEEVMIVGKSVAYANNAISEEMILQQTPMTSVLSVIDNLPGVLINEGDTFGADDWSTTISIRGFQTSLDEQQIGMTIDGIANGNSNYGGGAKANRYIDSENLQLVEVSQGTADIASRSHEALGGTLNFVSIDPSEDEKLIFSYTSGDFGANKFYSRYETGRSASGLAAWISVSSQESSDFYDQSAENIRDHAAAKVVWDLGSSALTGYVSYDDTHEDNYQRVTLSQFQQNPEWDGLTADWTGTPYIDQVYRKGWSTLRENTFGYLQFDFNGEAFSTSSNVYFHSNSGRGDWLPPYIVAENGDQVYFVDADGNALAPMDGCESSILFPYGGSGPEADPACHVEGAVPVGSYRHTHYSKNRLGFNSDASLDFNIGGADNTARAGVWYEHYVREESRDWHQIIDSRSSYYFNHEPYWVQYDREFPIDTFMVYLDDTVSLGGLTLNAGMKQFFVELEREDNFTGASYGVNSDSDILWSYGAVYALNDNLEAFTGYSENYAALKDGVLEDNANALNLVEPETADNFDIGLRYNGDRIQASLTYYDIQFDNRVTQFSVQTGDGIDFLEEGDAFYENMGGIESSGIEASFTAQLTETLRLYSSLTLNDSTYVGTGSVENDERLDIRVGNTVFGSAEEMAVISLDWAKDNKQAGISGKHVGKRWMDVANTQAIDAYNVVDLYIGTRAEFEGDIKAVNVRLVMNNAFDESYIAGVAGGWGGWIGAPRTTAINISAEF